MSAAGPLVVIGMGNVLLRDDGVGVRVVEALRETGPAALGTRDHATRALPEGTRLVDGGTLWLDLLDALDGARAAILVDAVDLGLPPGTITRHEGDALLAVTGPGVYGPSGLLDLARLTGAMPASAVLVGVQVGEIDAGLSLTPGVEAALPAAVDAVIAELGRLGPAARAGAPSVVTGLVPGGVTP